MCFTKKLDPTSFPIISFNVIFSVLTYIFLSSSFSNYLHRMEDNCNFKPKFLEKFNNKFIELTIGFLLNITSTWIRYLSIVHEIFRMYQSSFSGAYFNVYSIYVVN